MTIWHWVRHGPTNAKNFVGWRDLPADLSDHGVLTRLAAALPANAPVVSSDLIRAVQTADAIVGSRRRLPAQPGLREFHFGNWEGRHFSEIANAYPDLSRNYWENPGAPCPPGGESWDMGSARVSAYVDHLARLYGVAEIIAVAHIGVILTQLHRVLGGAAQEVLTQPIDNLSITSLDPTRGEVLRINHLP